MGRSSKKGPYIDAKLQAKIETLNRGNDRKVIRTWARACTIFPGMVGHTIADPQRPPACADFRDRADGRSQAWRVRANAHLPRSWQGRRPPRSSVSGEGRRWKYALTWAGSGFQHARHGSWSMSCGDDRCSRRRPCSGSFRTKTAFELEKLMKSVAANAENNYDLDPRRSRGSRRFTRTRARRCGDSEPRRVAEWGESTNAPAASRSSPRIGEDS